MLTITIRILDEQFTYNDVETLKLINKEELRLLVVNRGPEKAVIYFNADLAVLECKLEPVPVNMMTTKGVHEVVPFPAPDPDDDGFGMPGPCNGG